MKGKSIWYFTFAIGTENAKKYIKIEAADEQDARSKIIGKFGNSWSFCYPENEWRQGNGKTIADLFKYEEIKL